MSLSFYERRQILRKANYLDLKPLRIYSEEISEDQLVTILIPKFKSAFAVRYIVPKLKTKVFKLKLDELGSATWLMINGKSNVAEIIKKLDEKFGEKIKPVQERVIKFLTQLYEQRLITFEEIKGV